MHRKHLLVGLVREVPPRHSLRGMPHFNNVRDDVTARSRNPTGLATDLTRLGLKR